MHPVLTTLKERFPDDVLEVREEGPYLDLVAKIRPQALPDIGRFLHDDPGTAFDMLSDICSVDYPEDTERFELVYLFKSLPHNHRLRMKVRVTEDDAAVPTLTSVWQGANFLEREVYDLMGIRFDGHPDLRRILMPEDYDEGYPLRKDFPVEGKGWRATFPFIPRLDEPSEGLPEAEVPPEDQTPFLIEAEERTAAGKPVRRETELLLNMGPQHPATHGVLRIVLELEGERVVKATPDLGYLHRGVEKLCEALTYQQIIPHTDRLDYVCSMLNNYAFVRAVEKLLNLKIPMRAEYIRTIVAEMQRIVGHLFWLGTQALDIGAMTVFFWTFREREVLLDLFEKLCGARLTLNYYRIGGVDSDFTPDLVQRMQAFLDDFPAHLQEYDELLRTNRIWLARTRNVALLSAEDAINLGCTGPVLRGSGVSYDVRKAEPYGAYDKVEWEVPIGKNGDTYDRYWVRMEEMKQSARIIRQCLAQMPEGPILADAPQIIPPPKKEVMRDMQSHIHHFIIYTLGFKTPKGETYCASEGAKGELGFFIVSDGGSRPYRLKIRSPSFVHLGAFDHMARGYLIADIVTIFGTYDVVMGEVDR
jgi:NADH-quinone oxidoreductase subunit C/D